MFYIKHLRDGRLTIRKHWNQIRRVSRKRHGFIKLSWHSLDCRQDVSALGRYSGLHA